MIAVKRIGHYGIGIRYVMAKEGARLAATAAGSSVENSFSTKFNYISELPFGTCSQKVAENSKKAENSQIAENSKKTENSKIAARPKN